MSVFRILLLYFFFWTFSSNTAASQYNKPLKKTGITEKITKSPLLQSHPAVNKNTVSLVFILVIMVLILFYFYYQNNQLKRKNKQKDIKQKIQLNIINAAIDSQEIGRKKIASFLHDDINSLLSSVGLHLNTFTAQNNIQSDEITKAKAILEEVHDRLRDISHELIPVLLVRFGLLYALEDLCEKNSNSNLHFQFSSSIPTKKRYIEKFEMNIYFIVSELLNNIIKHSEASKAEIALHEKNDRLIITIQDNGKGFTIGKLNETEGFGLNRIRARIKKLKGNFNITSKKNEVTGTTVKIEVPI
jgi:two-component system NarL family sensor kinase